MDLWEKWPPYWNKRFPRLLGLRLIFFFSSAQSVFLWVSLFNKKNPLNLIKVLRAHKYINFKLLLLITHFVFSKIYSNFEKKCRKSPFFLFEFVMNDLLLVFVKYKIRQTSAAAYSMCVRTLIRGYVYSAFVRGVKIFVKRSLWSGTPCVLCGHLVRCGYPDWFSCVRTCIPDCCPKGR